MSTICNATPLIYLSRVGRLDLLRTLFVEVLAPPAVIAEVHPKTPALTSPLTDGWLVRTPVNDTAMADALTRRLGGRGEAEVIALALEQSDSLALIDERAARLVCQELGIQVRGTLGVLLEAKTRGLLPEVRPIIEGLVDGGFWLDRATHERVLLLAGEKRGP